MTNESARAALQANPIAFDLSMAWLDAEDTEEAAAYALAQHRARMFASTLPKQPRRGSSGRRNKRQPSKRPESEDKVTCLYRFYDADDLLLYIGMTSNLKDRTFSHARSSSWMEFAVRSTIERHPSRAEAEEAESAAIRAEGPLFNVANNDPGAERRLIDYLVEHDRRDLLAPAVSRG